MKRFRCNANSGLADGKTHERLGNPFDLVKGAVGLTARCTPGVGALQLPLLRKSVSDGSSPNVTL